MAKKSSTLEVKEAQREPISYTDADVFIQSAIAVFPEFTAIKQAGFKASLKGQRYFLQEDELVARLEAYLA